jgi:hypothetical protein
MNEKLDEILKIVKDLDSNRGHGLIIIILFILLIRGC